MTIGAQGYNAKHNDVKGEDKAMSVKGLRQQRNQMCEAVVV